MKIFLALSILVLVVGLWVFALIFASSGPKISTTTIASANANVSQIDTSTPTPLPKDVAKHYVTLTYKWSKEAFGNVMVADFVFDNGSPYDARDLTITCTHYAPSGTEIDKNTRTIYETVPAKSKKTVKGFNMGLIHTQAAKTLCQIDDLIM